MDNFYGDRRRNPRVSAPYILRFYQVESISENVSWDVAKIKDISRRGICFCSSERYPKGALLHLKMRNPMACEDIFCQCRVVRSEYAPHTQLYSFTAVYIEMIEKGKQDAFFELLDHCQEKEYQLSLV